MKKSLKTGLIILSIIVLIGLGFLAVDYMRIKEQKKPIFALKTQIYRDGGTVEYLGLGYKVINFNKLDGSNEAKIGTWFMDYNNFKNELYNITNTKEDIASFVGTILEETTTYMIVQPNEDEEERKTADKIQINYGTDHIDYLYGIGRKVVIKYTGNIMETYPAQINTDEILIDGYEEFELSVKEDENMKKTKILNNKEINIDGVDYNLYYYGINEVDIKVNNEILPLSEALKTGKITLNAIIVKANKDLDSKKIDGDIYKDGGSIIYKYDAYTIIKCHTLDGNRDLYICRKGITLENIK